MDDNLSVEEINDGLDADPRIDEVDLVDELVLEEIMCEDALNESSPSTLLLDEVEAGFEVCVWVIELDFPESWVIVLTGAGFDGGRS